METRETMEQVREKVFRIMKENNITQSQVVKYINTHAGYTVEPSLFSKIINGLFVSPKAYRVIADTASFVKKELERREREEA